MKQVLSKTLQLAFASNTDYSPEMTRPTPILVLGLVLILSACEAPQESTEQVEEPETAKLDKPLPSEGQTTDKSETSDMTENPEVAQAISQGLVIEELEIGEGPAIEPGVTANMHYTGWLYDESQPENKGEKFDSSHDRGRPLPVEFGVGRVIKGWDLGVLGMRAGGKRTLVIPPELGYGQRGTPGGPIPPNATLVFEVEVVDIP